MKHVLLLILSSFTVSLFGHSNQHNLICRQHLAEGWSSPDSQRQQYAPDRFVDIGHFDLNVTPDFKKRTVAGVATFTFRPIGKPLEELRLDAMELDVEKVEGSVKVSHWENTDKAIIINFSKPLPPNRPAQVKITYDCEPQHGLYFRTPEMGYDPQDSHLWTQGETTFSRYWYPCFDAPNEFITSSITCHVPKDMEVLSNGRKDSETINPSTGLKSVTWKQEQPHVTYLISLVAGHFERIQDNYGDLPMSFWTTPSDIAYARNSFRETKQCMEFFEKETGVPYPWHKYDQVCVHDFMWGGMENTTLTTLNNYTLFSNQTENLKSSQNLVAHEIAHQWFGNLVTMKDWSHTWLNEGFATYYTHLFRGHKDGIDEMNYALYRDLNRIIDRKNDTTAMVNREYSDPIDMFRKFGGLSYTKGGWVLHMLRSQLGPDVYRDVVKTYLERHRHGNVITENLRTVIEEKTGKSYDRFFDQYVYHAHHPELDITYSWDNKSKLAKVSVKQVQKVSDKVLLFHVPLPIRFTVDGKKLDQTLQVTKATEDFYIPLDKAPQLLRIDPNLTLLAKITFKPSNDMLDVQLANSEDPLGRQIAAQQLGKRKDQKTVEKLKQVLHCDSFFGVRVAASKALKSIGNDAALQALIDSMEQPDARVRRQVLSDIGSFHKPDALKALKSSLAKEKNLFIRADALKNLPGHDDAAIDKLILQSLSTNTFRQEEAIAAIAALRKLDKPAHITPLLHVLKNEKSKFNAWGFASGLKALGHLARNQEDKAEVRKFLVNYVDHLNFRKSQAAIEALGTLGDTQAIPVLQKLADVGDESEAAKAASSAIDKLNASRKPEEALEKVNKELSELKKSNEKLQKQLDDLIKKVEAKKE